MNGLPGRWRVGESARWRRASTRLTAARPWARRHRHDFMAGGGVQAVVVSAPQPATAVGCVFHWAQEWPVAIWGRAISALLARTRLSSEAGEPRPDGAPPKPNPTEAHSLYVQIMDP